MLDVGCGGGWAVVQIAQRFPDTSCVGIDVEPYSIDLARQLIVEQDLADRCEALVRSVEKLEEDERYDVATSFLVVHEIPPDLKRAAFAAVARALKPDGYFLIFDEVYPETDEALRTMPTRFAALAQWYEVTWGNVVDTRSVTARDVRPRPVSRSSTRPASPGSTSSSPPNADRSPRPDRSRAHRWEEIGDL